MDLLFAPTATCDYCHERPALGFLYACQQDAYCEGLAKQQLEVLQSLHERDPFPSPAEQLRACGFSPSIVDQIRQGHVFDTVQIEVLKNQKLDALRVIDKQLSRGNELEPWNLRASRVHEVIHSTARLSMAKELSPNVAMVDGIRTARATTSKLIQKFARLRRRSQIIPKCSLKCCHTCRPYFKDRTFIPLHDAIEGNLIPQRFISQKLQVAEAQHAENLGLRTERQPRFRILTDSSDEVTSDSEGFNTTSSGGEDEDVEVSPHSLHPNLASWTATEYSDQPKATSYARRLRQRLVPFPSQQNSDQVSHSQPVRREIDPAAHANDNKGTSSGLWRRIARGMTPSQYLKSHSMNFKSASEYHGVRHAKSAHLLGRDDYDARHLEAAEGAEHGSKTAKEPNSKLQNPAKQHVEAAVTSADKSTGSVVIPPARRMLSSDNDRSSSVSEEVAVEGGVALTEEAVVTHHPDILT